MKTVVFLPAAAKALRKHRSEAPRIVAKITAYAEEPSSVANNVKALAGSSAFRLRVGDFRIVFEDTEDEIIVTKIGPRGSIYE